MKILLLSAYDAVSHQRWYHTLIGAFDQFEWTTLRLAPRHFNWRIRGNSLSWAFTQKHVLERDYDLVVATSMVDLSTLRGFVPSLANVPTLVYFHENQFAYPPSTKQFSTVEPQILNLYTALAADQIVFNSHYNYDTFISGVEGLLKKLPDHVPLGLVDQLKKQSYVLPVPLADDCYHHRPLSQAGDLSALWNHRGEDEQGCIKCIKIVWAARWEYDKGPDRLLAVLRLLEFRGLDYRIAVIGQQFRNIPNEFRIIESEFSHRLAQFGFLDSVAEYKQYLKTADIVLSTALHEFQGISVLEAIAAGCVPVLPGRQVYPELVSSEFIYESCLDNIEREAVSAVDLIEEVVGEGIEPPGVNQFSLGVLKKQYETIFQKLLADSYRC